MSTQILEKYKHFVLLLQNEDCRPAALTEIKNLLIQPAPEVLPSIRNVGISKIINCFNVSDQVQVDLACEVLRACFEKFETGDVLRYYTGHIMYLLRHEKACVRRVAIDEVYKTVSLDPCLLPNTQYIDLFVVVAQLVSDEDVGIANKAIKITSILPSEAYHKVLEEMKIALELNSSTKCNAYEVVINISSKSSELFDLCVEIGYIDYMVNELQSSDILYQLNILELLSQLAIKPYALTYLVKQGALQKIATLIGELQNNPLGNILTPGYMKFFGCVAHHYPKEIFTKYPGLLDALFNAFESDDVTILPIILDTLGFIGATIEGKLCLVALGSRYTQTVEKIGNLIKNSPTEIKVRALYCYASLIGIETDPQLSKAGPVDQRVTLMTREWFRSLSRQPSAMETLLNMCKNPFPDIKLAAFSLLDAVCQHNWGADLVANVAGFVEFLLDRSMNDNKESKEARYDIIKRLSLTTVFEANIITRMETYVEQGPFYSESAMEVAMEEGD